MNQEEKNATIARAALSEFDYVCRIDVHTGKYVIYYAEDGSIVVPWQKLDDYEQMTEMFTRQYMAPEEEDALADQMKLDHVIRQLDDMKEYVLYAEARIADQLQKVYKKLRFCYADEKKQFILLTEKDVSETFLERKKRKAAEKKYEELLTNMPIAISSTKVLLDENGKPYDFQYIYCNPAHEELEGVKPGELLGKGFYQFFDHTDPEWLQLYYDTAWLGIPHIIRKYSPEIGKDLLIHTFCTEPGYCDCVLQDVTQENFLFRELHQSRTEMIRVLESTTMAVFQYNPVTGEIKQNEYTSNGKGKVYCVEELLEIFEDTGRVEAKSISLLKDCFSRIQKGEHFVTAPLRCTKRGSSRWIWLKVSLFDYLDEVTKERKVMGYIQDINQDMIRQKELLAQAQTDALTGILNVGAGRAQIQKLLSSSNHRQKAMFMMDVDNFKIVNDSYGHIMGDKTLKCFADILSRVFAEPAVVYRLGGDEFSVFIPDMSDAESEVAKLMKKLSAEIENAKKEFPFMSISIGIYITDSCESYEQFYVAADKALYQTKKNKKGYYTVLDDSKKV